MMMMMIMMIKPHFRSWWALLTCLLSDHRECRMSAFHLRYWPTLCMIAWEVERQRDCVSGWNAAWLHGRLTGNVTAWAVCVWKVSFKTHQCFALPHRFSCKPNMEALHAEDYLWHSETAHVLGTASSSLSNHREKIQSTKKKKKKSVWQL